MGFNKRLLAISCFFCTYFGLLVWCLGVCSIPRCAKTVVGLKWAFSHKSLKFWTMCDGDPVRRFVLVHEYIKVELDG
jgi:hypothetical protein